MERFLLAAEKYNHVKFYNNFITLKIVLWGLYGGFLIGIAAAYYNKVYIGGFIRKLLKKEALSPDSALSFSDLKIKRAGPLKLALKRNGALKRYAVIANEDEVISEREISPFKKRLRRFFGREESVRKYDLDRAKFYIPEELKYRADTVYDEKGSNPAAFIILAAALTVAVLAVSFLIPELVTMLDNFLDIIIKTE